MRGSFPGSISTSTTTARPFKSRSLPPRRLTNFAGGVIREAQLPTGPDRPLSIAAGRCIILLPPFKRGQLEFCSTFGNVPGQWDRAFFAIMGRLARVEHKILKCVH